MRKKEHEEKAKEVLEMAFSFVAMSKAGPKIHRAVARRDFQGNLVVIFVMLLSLIAAGPRCSGTKRIFGNLSVWVTTQRPTGSKRILNRHIL